MLRNSLRRVISTAVVLAAATTAQAQTTVDFEAFIGMSNSPGSGVPLASQLGTQLIGSGVKFSSFSDYVAVVSLGTGHATSGAIGIGGTSASGALSYSSPIRISFWDPANAMTQGITSFVQIRGDRFPTAGNIIMRVFDPLGALLATIVNPDMVGTTMTYSGVNVHAIELSSESATVAFDDLEFGIVTPVPPDPSVVPEPASLALFGAGALMLGTIVRRRRRLM